MNTIRFLLLSFVVLLLVNCNETKTNNKKLIDNPREGSNENCKTIFPIEGKYLKFYPEVYLDTMYCSINGDDFLISPTGLLKWGYNYQNTFQLKTDVYIEKAFFYLDEDFLIVFYVETDMDGGASRVEKINLETKERIWMAEIYAFNLGQPYVRCNFAYLTTFSFVGKLNLANGSYDYKFEDLYDYAKYSFNSFDTIIFKDDFTYFISPNSRRIDSVIVNEKTKEMKVRK